MESITLTKNDKQKKIFIGKDKLFHWSPIIATIRRGMWSDLVVFIATTIFLFPNIIYRIHMSKYAGVLRLKKFISKGWQVSSSGEVLFLKEKHVLFTEKPNDDGKIWMTDGVIMEEVEIVMKQGFWKSMQTTTIAFFKVRMWLLSIVWMLSNLTGLGDFVFTTLLYTRFPRWRMKQLEKKGFRPHSEFDEKELIKYKKQKRT